MPMTDPDLKAKWLAALRSGEFPQANGYLKAVVDPSYSPTTPNGKVGYCCLGVLCMVQGVDMATQLLRLNVSDLPATFAGGLSVDEMHLLAAMNDGSGFKDKFYEKTNFSGIADHIEAHL